MPNSHKTISPRKHESRYANFHSNAHVATTPRKHESRYADFHSNTLLSFLSNGYLLAIISAVSFATSLVLARISYDHGSDAQTVLVVRFSILALILYLWNRANDIQLALTKKHTISCLLIGIAYFVGIGSYLASVAYIPVSMAVLVFYTFPILVTLLSAIIHKNWPHPLQMLALCIAFAGLILALNVETSGLNSIGLTFAVFASLGVTVNMVASQYVLRHIPTTTFGFYTSLSTLTLSLIIMWVSNGLQLPDSFTGILAFSGMLIFFFSGYLATYNGIRLLGAVPMSTMMNLEPVSTILIAMVLLGEVLSGQQVLGGFIVLIGIFMAQWPQLARLIRKKRP